MRPVYQKEANKFKSAPLPNSAIESQAKILTLKAFETYDPSKSQLNTHVTNHLKHLQRYVLEYQNIGKIPEHRGLAIGKYQTVFDNLKEDLGREPTDMELADNLG
jgi:DNA-directed RNA polymerase specialized sigma subunit